MGWLLGVAVGFLAFIGVAASATHYLQEPYNPGFLDFPTIVALHVVLGGVYLALAPFQFEDPLAASRLPPWRRQPAGRHRGGDRGNGPVHGAGDPLLGLAGAGDHRPLRGMFLFSLVKGFIYVRAGQVDLHREWMIRAFAIGLAIATQRVIFFPALMITMTDPTDGRFGTLLVVALAVAFVVHASVAEFWIRATRRSGTLRAGEVKAV
jgi:Predicted membrane protein (DUF2306)